MENGILGPAAAAEHKSVVVEVEQADRSGIAPEVIQNAIDAYIRRQKTFSPLFPVTEFHDPFLTEHVVSVRICLEDECGIQDSEKMNLDKEALTYRVFKVNRNGPDTEEIEGADEGDGAVAAASHWTLPAQDFQGMWENLVYDSNVKNDLLRFVETTLLLADKKVDTNIISCNRVVLLHGPPGTGKTSLCKALAQKLAIRLNHRYKVGQLIEINSHSLFSKWFSESGKLVQKMFSEIRDLIEDPNAFVCVLIDEVESLTAARSKAMQGSEPGDAVRVVNALLTQLDSIKHFPNLLVLTTSNITGAIDLAFIDRADIKQYIGPPSQGAIYKIFYSCIRELVRTNILDMEAQIILPVQTVRVQEGEIPGASASARLWKIANSCTGLSGRTLRKIPFLALAMYCDARRGQVPVLTFLDALTRAMTKQMEDREELS